MGFDHVEKPLSKKFSIYSKGAERKPLPPPTKKKRKSTRRKTVPPPGEFPKKNIYIYIYLGKDKKDGRNIIIGVI